MTLPPEATTPDQIIRRSRFWQMIADLPSTNFRIFIGVGLSMLFVIVTLVGVMMGRINNTNENPLYIIGTFLLLQMGLDVAQFKFKRDTYYAPQPPVVAAPPDREDAPRRVTQPTAGVRK